MKRVIVGATVALICAAVSSAAVPATAKDGGPYVSLGVLYVMQEGSEFSDVFQAHNLTAEMSMETGMGGLVAIGQMMPSGWQIELELGYRRVSVDEMKGLSISGPFLNQTFDGTFPAEGTWTTVSFMLNGFYSFEAGNLRPYLGGGLGLARHRTTLDDVAAPLEGIGNQEDAFRGTFDDDVEAYQIMAGIGWRLFEKTTVRLGYRYFATKRADFDGTAASFGTHNVEAGVLCHF